jgi:zinc protease
VTQITTNLSDIEGFTVADIQAAAQRWLVDGKAWRASVLSANAAPQAAAQ